MAAVARRRAPSAVEARRPAPIAGTDRYLNRELSTLQFNERVLALAEDPAAPLLERAAHELLARGHDCVLLVNGDSPTLPPRILSAAIDRLRRPGDRMVLGPASDGGKESRIIGAGHAQHPRV